MSYEDYINYYNQMFKVGEDLGNAIRETIDTSVESVYYELLRQQYQNIMTSLYVVIAWTALITVATVFIRKSIEKIARYLKSISTHIDTIDSNITVMTEIQENS